MYFMSIFTSDMMTQELQTVVDCWDLTMFILGELGMPKLFLEGSGHGATTP